MTTSSQTVNRNLERLRTLWERGWLKGLLLVAAVFLVYQPALQGKFIWDDDSWTSNISSLLSDFSGLRLMWCKPTALQQYYPLTGTTFWLDYQLWGFRTLPYHVENVLLHAFAALLFWQLLRRLQTPGTWLASCILALHPLMVESVGWITERKNVLSLVFYLGALLAYERFTLSWKVDPASAAGSSSTRCWIAYALSFLMFLAALLAKATAFSLPAVILLICWWKRGRIRWRADVAPTLPFFALALGLGIGTAWLEKNHVGAAGPEWAISFPERCLIAGRALWFYTGKLFWPADLCFVYPRWHLDTMSLRQWTYPVTAIGTLLALWFARARIGRGPAAAGFFFAGTLFPVLGFMNAYFMRYSFVCDHWAYLSSLGLIALASAMIVRAVESFRAPAVLYGLATIILLVLGGLTWRQCRMYADSETLWRTTIARNPSSYLAHTDLGGVFLDMGRLDEAIAHFKKALEVRPDYVEAYNNLGNILLKNRQVNEAMEQFQKALEIQPDNAMIHNSFGNALLQKGQVDEAIVHYQKALKIMPDSAYVCCGLGNALLQKGQVDEAMEQFQKAIRLQPDLAMAHYDLGNLLLQKGRVDDAIACYQKALKINPGYAEAHYNLGNAFLQERSVDEAIQQYQSALEIKPDYAEAHINLGAVLLQKGRLDDAAEQFQQAINIQPDSARAHYNLSQVLLSKGRSDEAMAHLQKALEIRPDYAKAHASLGVALFQKGRVDEAIARFQKALELQPGDPDIHVNLGIVLSKKGRVDEAIACFQKALEISPSNSKACYNLTQVAWELATNPEASVRNGAKAIALVEQVEQFSKSGNPWTLETLATAYAEVGRFPEAIASAERAQQLAAQQGNASLADVLGKQIKLYQAGTPFRDTGMPVAPSSLAPP
jgi:tetratricopeptide (TPR) repeat protein